MFRVSFLKKKVGGGAVVALELPRMDEYGRFKPPPPPPPPPPLAGDFLHDLIFKVGF